MTVRRILGLAFLCSVLLYGALAVFLARGAEAAPPPPLILAAFYFVALGALLAGLILVPRMNTPGGPVVAMALAEVPAIMGLVLALVSGSPRDFHILGGSSFLALLYLTLKKDE